MTTEGRGHDTALQAVAVEPEPGRSMLGGSERTPPHHWRGLLFAGGAYFVLSTFMWSNVWTGNPGSTTTCGCGDSAGAIWVMEWPAYAMTHGLSLLYSTFMNHPTGINLVANPGVLALSLPLAPVTWLFGPIASLNVAFTLAPVLSALAMFFLLRRWVSWAPAAFFGGLMYGFCPFIVVSLTQGWVNLGMAVSPPLIVLCLDELLLRQRHRPERVGLVLGLLVVLQFFISTEILLIVAIVAVCGIGLIVVYTALQFPKALMHNARPALIGVGVGAVTAIVLLAYPAWVAVAGPAHFSGLIWPNGFPQPFSNVVLQDFIHPAPAYESTILSVGWHQRGGYQGTPLSFQYFGLGVLVVLLIGLVVWRRDRRLWFFGAITVLSGAFSLGQAYPLPWRLFAHLAFFENILPGRFVLITYLSASVMLALVVDHTYRSVNQLRVAPRGEVTDGSVGSRWPSPPHSVGAMVAVIVAAIAIVPPARYLSSAIPITTQRVVLPAWFRIVAPHLRDKQVLLVFPTYFAGYESPSSWQAVDRMTYSMVNIGGPAGFVVRAGKERPGAAVIADTSLADSVGSLGTGAILAVRTALDDWGVTMIVIPDQADLPLYDQTPSVVTSAEVMAAATGEHPIHQADAWVWSEVRSAPQVAHVTGAQIRACTIGLASRGVHAVDSATACVLKAGRRSSHPSG
jgi:hypothetical protein